MKVLIPLIANNGSGTSTDPTAINKVPDAIAGDIAVMKADGSISDAGVNIASIRDKTFVFEQMTALAVWNITHNMNKFPSVHVVDSGGSEVIGDVVYVNLDNIRITFSSAFAGAAYLN